MKFTFIKQTGGYNSSWQARVLSTKKETEAAAPSPGAKRLNVEVAEVQESTSLGRHS